MTRKPRLLLLLTALLVAALALVTTVVLQNSMSNTHAAAGETAPMAAAAKTSFPGLAAAEGEPELPSMRTAAPAKGQIVQADGPFDDRFVLEDLAFNGSAATGALKVTSDVSDLLELQVLAGFYDENGALLGTDRIVHHMGSEGHNHAGPPEEREEFTIPVPSNLQGKAVAATVGVPVLVNE